MDKIFLTQQYLPPLEDFMPYLEKIWKSKWLTNNGDFHKQFEKERAISDVKEASVSREKMMIESMNGSIAQHKKRAEELKEQRIAAEKEMTAVANQKTAELTADIVKLII